VSCPLRWQAAPGPPCRRRTCLVHCRYNAPVLRGALCSSSLIREASPARRCNADLGCQGARRLLQQQTLVALSITFVMFLGPHARAQYPCTCPPLAIKGEAYHVTTQALLDTLRRRARTLELPQQSNTQWSRVLRSGGPNHSKSSRVHVLNNRLAGQVNRLNPFLILGFRVDALRHPAREFPLRHELYMVVMF
jgi:hypothetical protein